MKRRGSLRRRPQRKEAFDIDRIVSVGTLAELACHPDIPLLPEDVSDLRCAKRAQKTGDAVGTASAGKAHLRTLKDSKIAFGEALREQALQ